MIKQLSRDEMFQVLNSNLFGRLGCITAEGPYVVPINFIWDGDNIYSHSLHGTKISAMRADHRVCLQVDEISDGFHWRSVIVNGMYEEVTDPTKRDEFLKHLSSRLPRLTPVESSHREPLVSDPVVFRIVIGRLSGVGEF